MNLFFLLFLFFLFFLKDVKIRVILERNFNFDSPYSQNFNFYSEKVKNKLEHPTKNWFEF